MKLVRVNFSKPIKALFLLLFVWTLSSCSASDTDPIDIEEPVAEIENTYPDSSWKLVDNPEKYGFSKSKLKEVSTEFREMNSAAIMVLYKGHLIFHEGSVDKKYQSHSTRKSFLSALFGNYIVDGTIKRDATMADLGINDVDGLSDLEKTASVRDLLRARSGIYHPALYETASMLASKPARYSHAPGTFWYYNNWDFNALGTIFMKETGKDFYKALEEEIAKPIQMNFKATDGEYYSGSASVHKAYPFRISASDFARFGLLMLNKGKWKDKQVVPSEWVEEMTKYEPDIGTKNGYGYMWWLNRSDGKYPLNGSEANLPPLTYKAAGVGGQSIFVIPEYEMVIVHRADTDQGIKISSSKLGHLIRLVLDSHVVKLVKLNF